MADPTLHGDESGCAPAVIIILAGLLAAAVLAVIAAAVELETGVEHQQTRMGGVHSGR